MKIKGNHRASPILVQMSVIGMFQPSPPPGDPILPNRQLAKVYSFEQTSVDDPAKISEKSDGCLTFCFAKCMTIKG